MYYFSYLYFTDCFTGFNNFHNNPASAASWEVAHFIMRNKTGLQPVSRTVEQVPLVRGLGVGAKSLWLHS